MIKLSANENFYGCSPEVTTALAHAHTTTSLYPDYRQTTLKQKIAAHCKVEESQIALGVGMVGLIDNIIRHFTDFDDEIVTFERSFIGYKEMAELNNRTIHFAPLQNLLFSVESLFGHIKPKTKLVLIANPNNPTGSMLTHTELVDMLQKIPDNILVVVDEAYLEYVTSPDFPQTISLLNQFPNLIILRGFSKIYGLAGLRIGYTISSELIANKLEQKRLPFSINSMATIAAIAALGDQSFIQNCRQLNTVEREFLYDALLKSGFNVLPSQGNFLFVYFQHDEEKELAYNKILLADIMVCNLKVFGQSNSLRITLGDRAANSRILEAMKVI